jgi:GT2 family glycosyltransferase
MISVIIVNYHSAQLTERAVRSVFQENEELEVLIVDNSTTPEEREYLHTAFDGQKATLIFNERNVGFAVACNQAFSASQGEFIFLLNPDAYVVPPCLGVLREFMENAPGVGSVSPLVCWDSAMTYLFPDTFLPSPAQDFYMQLAQLSPFFGYLYSHCRRRKNLALWKSSSPVKAENLSGGSVMVRRSALEEIGGLFDERFFMFYEDNDLFLRLGRAGYSLYTVPAAKAVHHYRHTAQKLDLMARSRELYYRKHFRNPLLQRIGAHIPNRSGKKEYVDAGTWKTTPSFSVPPGLRKGYLFEWSPHHLFFPSVGYFGKGETFIFSEEIWNALDKGNYYSRFSDDRKLFYRNTILAWRKG